MSIADHLDNFVRRIVADALTEATSTYWVRRAESFDAARPRPGDFTGHATEAELAERDKRLAEQAVWCRVHAELIRQDPDPWRADLDEFLAAEVA